MSDLNVIYLPLKPRFHAAVRMTEANARAIHEDDRFFTSWLDTDLLRVITLNGSQYLRPGYWVVVTSDEDNKVYSDEEMKNLYDVPADYDPDQRVLF